MSDGWSISPSSNSVVVCLQSESICKLVCARSVLKPKQTIVRGADILLQQLVKPKSQPPVKETSPASSLRQLGTDPATLPDVSIGVREHFLCILRGDGGYHQAPNPKPKWCTDAQLILQRVVWYRPLVDGPQDTSQRELEAYLHRCHASSRPQRPVFRRVAGPRCAGSCTDHHPAEKRRLCR